MPAAAFDASAAAAAVLIVHSMITHDGVIGAIADEDGIMINNGFDLTTARERVEHKNYAGLVVTAVSNNPSVRMQIDAKVYNHAGTAANPHPGAGIPASGLNNYVSAIRAGVTLDAEAWWELMEPSLNVPSGDVNTSRFTANLWNPSYLGASNYVYQGNTPGA
jgi:hypothetical protein